MSDLYLIRGHLTPPAAFASSGSGGDRNNGDDIQPQEAVVREILTNVKKHGDRALLEYTEKFDRQVYTAEQLRVSGSELDAAYQQITLYSCRSSRVLIGTRVPMRTLLDYLEAGDSLEVFLDHFPSVSQEQAIAALELAKEMLTAYANPA